MSVDMTQFHAELFEECLGYLDAMKTDLESIDLNAFDAEKMATIKRGAHTIKGDCAMFEFTTVSDYAKIMEMLLGEMLEHHKETNTANINAMLESVAYVRNMITTLQDKGTLDGETAAAHSAKLQAMIS
ncbi:MAG: two-component system, chemotaxis family, sensor kinase CheA [Pseudomonadota bacterium]|jgi:chemotaxis protein histidine kinase CheA|nr:two-component system, chemotaxis family, sensor kinase CheA [Pseudomonadota bacterium]